MRALSGLEKIPAIIKAEKLRCALVRKERGECLWLMALAKILLDVVMYVAASVIFSLLLISGNVERNPGPGPGGTLCFLIDVCILRVLFIDSVL